MKIQCASCETVTENAHCGADDIIRCSACHAVHLEREKQTAARNAARRLRIVRVSEQETEET